MAPVPLLVLVHAAEPGLLGVARSRIGELPSIYARPDDALAATCRSEDRVLLAVLHDAAREPDLRGVVAWGRRSPIASVEELLDAPAARLADLPTPSCVAAIGHGRARLASSSGPLQCVYEAGGAGLRVWSSHALAAAFVAHGDVRLDPVSVAELVACEFVGGDATVFEGVRALPPGARVDVDGGRAQVGTCVSIADRWAPLPAEDAAAAAESHLLADLDAATRDAHAPALGLTAGLDSRTIAVAFATDLGAGSATALDGAPGAGVMWGADPTGEAGAARPTAGARVALRTATFDPGDRSEDVAGARALAAALGFAHEIAPMTWWTPAGGGHARMRAAAAWHDGQREAGYGAVVWPDGVDRWIAGVGAETGSAVYWRWLAPRREPASPRTLLRCLQRRFEPQLAGTDATRVRVLRERWRRWLADALATGHTGWDALDVVYADQRVRRWGRSQMPVAPIEWVPAYAGRELGRALASLPLDDRLYNGWQRRFIGARRPDLEPPRPERPRPPRGTLTAGRLVLAARRARRRLGGPANARSTPEIVWHELDFWRERRDYVEWLTDAVLDAPIVRDALGDGWADEQRRRFLAGDPRAAELTRLAAGPVAALEAVQRRAPDAARPSRTLLPAR